MHIDEVNDIVRRFGVQHKHVVFDEQRETLTSTLFDVPRRSSLGNGLIYEEGPDLLRTLLAEVSPEAIGMAMKQPGSRPYALNLWVVLGGYISARQQHWLDQGAEPGKPVDDPRAHDLALVVDFFARVSRVYREDGGLFAGEEGDTQAILDPATVARALALAEPVRSERWSALRRAAASLTLYNFMQHGEQRDGNFGHGPYPGPDDTVVWFEEFNDLQNDVVPWDPLDVAPMPVANVAYVYAATDVAIEANMFGALRVIPHDFLSRLRMVGAFTRDGDDLIALDDDALAELAARATERHALLFEQACGWDPDFRIRYGGPLFANHLVPFLRLAGIPAARDLVLDAFARSTPAVMEGITSDSLPSFWTNLQTVPGPQLYSPLASDSKGTT